MCMYMGGVGVHDVCRPIPCSFYFFFDNGFLKLTPPTQ